MEGGLVMNKTILKKKKCKKAKWLSEETLQISEERKKAKGKGEKEHIPIWMQSSKEQQGEIKKSSSVISAKKQRKTTEWESLEISTRKLETPMEDFMQRRVQ